MENLTDKDSPVPAHQPGQVFGPQQTAPPVSPSSPVPPESPIPAEQPAAVATPPAGLMVNGQMVSYNEQQTSQPNKRFGFKPGKKLSVGLIAALVVLGGSAAAYFGYIVPNKPENIWATSLSRMGKGYDKLSSYVSNYQAPKGYKISGKFSLSGAVNADGSLNSASDGSNSQTTANLSAGGLKLGLNILTIKSSGSVPDVYLKASGLDGVGPLLDNYLPGLGNTLGGLNNQWYFIDHTLFEQYLNSGTGSGSTVSKTDITQLLNAAAGPTKQYVFTGDTKNMAFVIKQKIGKETQDGRSVYHYKIGVDKANLIAYDNALCNSLSGTKLFKLLDGSTNGSQALKDCKDTNGVNDIKDSAAADVWVDTHTKLIHRVRVNDSSTAGNYFDVFQDYQGGSDLPFGVGFYSKGGGDTMNGSLNFDLNMSANTLSVKGALSSTGTDKETGSLNLQMGPSASAVKVQKPANAKNIAQLLSDLGFGDLSGGSGNVASGVQLKAKDTERQTDIYAMQSNLEIYFTDNGYYPTFNELTSASWRKANLQGEDEQAFKDPDGSGFTLSAKPAKNIYAYQPAPSGCDNVKVMCDHYTITATLSTGKTLAKQSLN